MPVPSSSPTGSLASTAAPHPRWGPTDSIPISRPPGSVRSPPVSLAPLLPGTPPPSSGAPSLPLARLCDPESNQSPLAIACRPCESVRLQITKTLPDHNNCVAPLWPRRWSGRWRLLPGTPARGRAGGMTSARVLAGEPRFGRRAVRAPLSGREPAVGCLLMGEGPYCYGPSTSGCMPTPQRIRSRLMQMLAVRRCGQCRGPWHVARCTAGSRAVIKDIH